MRPAFSPQPKPESRIQALKRERPVTLVTEKDFRRDVWDHDNSHCRWCHRRVIKTMARVPDRGEVHHVYGRGEDFRFDARFAILLCLECHEKVTGRVAERWIIVPVPTSVFLPIQGRELLDCREPIGFERVA